MDKTAGDIDIDLANRSELISKIKCINASIRTKTGMKKHPSGVYPMPVPYNPINRIAAIDYVEAEARHYSKIDLLNVHVYEGVKDEAHLYQLMKEPDWSLLHNRTFVSKITHLSNHYVSLSKLPEPIDSIDKLAMFLAMIRPAKKHLLGLTWDEVAKTVWEKVDGEYTFKKSHSLSYSHLVVVHMNLLSELRHASD